jgi:hypothetical protein
MTRSYSDKHINLSERARKQAEVWAQYGACDWCKAWPKMPCRDKDGFGAGSKTMTNPHTGRPKLEDR